ncbi:hypothetical protein C8Q73DRAFT_646116, partial [Cubamyces lactineus]
IYLPFQTLLVYHHLKFVLENAQQLRIMEDMHDSTHSCPERKDKHGQVVLGHFDTVLIKENGASRPTVMEITHFILVGYRVGRVQLLLEIPKQAVKCIFPGQIIPGHLAYFEWYSAYTMPN